ncbi:DUF3806 domain-containing protein [Prosthecomicrobium hirschii]|uniref:DUF3806 domain-containing protein n=1 Tax=Prosthecodimorpha hirschii TaxID=665126 RepID=A0A0P6VMK8_9HYPH|nr:DUF3806 domain-containing protein [Prosthecomicrobium hirschii]KPL52546.1 hypothetical protein ABB55_10190 [Prosthecomicrobium hirschii]MCW1841405.1 DUF3806 domain-containing protein [Prosthecomicrobium hirschii]TPQ52312.1 DUF3806 domain-containing protein [Prosthecomicrobium hirschii]
MTLIIRRLTPADRPVLEMLWRTAADKTATALPGARLMRQPTDLAILQSLIDDPITRAAVSAAAEAFAIAFGEVLIALEARIKHGIPLQWCVVIDEYGTHFAIKHVEFDALIRINYALENSLEYGGAFEVARLFSNLVTIIDEEVEQGNARRSPKD